MKPSVLARIASQLSSATAITDAVESQQARRDVAKREYVPPSDPLEESVAAIWTRLLRVDRVGRTDDFFLLGGHSLLATQMISRVSEVFGVQLPLVEIFAHSTLETFATIIRTALSAGVSTVQTPLVRAGRSAPAPLSYAQQRLWFLDQLEPNNPFYNEPIAMRLKGPLDAAAMALALADVVARHESLRTTFQLQGEEPVQVVAPVLALPLTQVDVSHLAAEEREGEARRLVREEVRRPFHLSVGPLFRVLIVKLGAEEHVLTFNLHHTISDGWSLGVLMNDLTALYEGYRSGSPVELPALPLTYGDYAIWQRSFLEGGALEQQLGYWKKNMAGAPASIQLPTDRVRPPVQSFQGSKRVAVLPAELANGLKALSRAEGTTLFITLVSAFNVLLARYSGQKDLVVGTAIAGRRHPETERLVGFFANTLVLRNDLSGEPTFRELLQRVRATTLGAYANQDVPFEKLVEELNPVRDMSRSPLFQVMIILQNAFQRSSTFGSLKSEAYSAASSAAKVDLLLNVSEDAGTLRCALEYNVDLYDGETIERMLTHYRTVLESAVAAPDKRLAELDVLGAEERRRLLVEWNDTAREYPRELCVYQLFEQQAARRPDAIAVACGDERILYAELNAQANRLAHHLRHRGIGRGQRVGLFIERSPAMFVGLLGIQKSGAAYVPLDPSYPAERVRATLDAAGISLLVAEEHLLSALPEYGGEVVCLDRDRDLIERESAENPLGGATPDDVVYVIFTSGSTGKPKGVELGHRGVVNLLDWMREELGFDENGVFPALASFAFDMSVPELYLALAAGGTVALAPKGMAADGEELTRFFAKHGATLVHATPTTWSLLLDAGFTGQNVTRCIGAEPLPTELFGRLMDAAPGTPLYNFYGPTETTVWSTFERFEMRGDRVVIGRPLANTQIYIVDRDGNPTAIGVPGEVLIGGDGVAKGYLGEQELTAEKFVPDSFSGDSAARVYRTGDLGRYLPDGRIEFAGRVDHQVKIRGYRIELGEIETVLTLQDAVREAVVLAREDEAGDKRLVAYVVLEADASVSTRDMREWVKQRLPEYMVPTAFVVLERMPLSPNGKVDRKALPAPEAEEAAMGGAMNRAMGDPAAEIIANIWAEVLKTAEITPTANFFELGGHSLLATKVVARIRQALRVNLPLGAIFDAPTVASLAARVKALVREDTNPVEAPLTPAKWGSKPKPLSFAQQRLWFLDQLEPNSSFYNVPMAMRLRGPFDDAAMAKALEAVIVRHESLRTTFEPEGEEPVQVVAARMALPLTRVDLSGLGETEREEEARRIVNAEARAPFNLARGPLFRALVVKIAPEEHVFMVNMHHAISDGWSQGVLMNDITALYEAFRLGAPSPLQPLPISYGDYAVWQRRYLEGGALERQLSYWKTRMAGAPPAIELPTDRVRPPVQTFRGSKQIATFSPELLAGLKALSRAEGATLFITLLSAFNLLLSRYSGQKDIVVGTANAGRHHAETEKLIGYFANTVVLRTSLEGEPTFRELMGRAREATLNAFANQDIPFEKLVEELNPVRDLSRSPLIQVMIIQQNAFQRSSSFGSLAAEGFSAAGSAAKIDLLLNVSEHEGRLRCVLEYNTDLYDASTIDRILDSYNVLLQSVVEDPSRRAAEISLHRPENLQQLLVDWNATAEEYPRDKRVHHLIEMQAAATPDAAAVIYGAEQLTYRELNTQANQLAHYLQGLGIEVGDRVGIYLARSLSLMVAMLAVQKCGAAYVPFDPTYPVERLRMVAEDGDIACIVTIQPLKKVMPDFAGGVVCLDREAEPIAAASSADLETSATPEDSMYIIFTSGSTGRPKGVEVPHRAVVNLLTWMAKELEMGPGDVFPALASFAFDMSVPELYLALVSGGTVLVADRHMSSNGEELAGLLKAQHATVVHATPTTWSLLLDAGFTGAGLKRCIGAEALPRELFGRLMKAADATPLYNFYGPTETTVWSTFRRFTSADETVVVGRPLANTQVYLLDEALKPAPVGVSGGIYIAGDGVAKGYFGQPELTAEKFLPNPFTGKGKMYSTGDVGRYLPDGRVEYIERADNQVKLRGFRIELGEIEFALSSHPAVREAVVIAREDQPGNKFLAAYFVAQDGATPVDTDGLRAFLKERLPDYMVPVGWMALERLPLSANGKVDRKKLPAPDALPLKSGDGQMPQTLVEIRLASIWESTLNVSSVRLDDDFFSLGGHSLLAVQMMAKAREAFGCELPLTLLFSAPRLGDLARAIQTERSRHPFKSLIPIRKTGTKPPLFCVSRPNVNALGFIFLARHLSPDQPVIGLQTQMEKDGKSWVYDQVEYEEKAREYIKVMREFYPEGPYLLTGFCEGAHIAFEMARQLVAMNLRVAMTAILDVWPVENTVSPTRYKLRSYLREYRKFRKKSLTEKFHFLTRSVFRKKKAGAGAAAVDPAAAAAAAAAAEQRRLIVQQVEKRYWPGRDFVPTRYSGQLTLFRTRKQSRVRIYDYTMGWGRRALGGVDVVPVSGDHPKLLREPYVIELAHEMQVRIEQALASHPTVKDAAAVPEVIREAIETS